MTNRNESVRGGPTGTCPGETTALLGEVSQRRAQVQYWLRVDSKTGAILFDGKLSDLNVYVVPVESN
jgi:hypothetical protein